MHRDPDPAPRWRTASSCGRRGRVSHGGDKITRPCAIRDTSLLLFGFSARLSSSRHAPGALDVIALVRGRIGRFGSPASRERGIAAGKDDT